MPCWSGRVPRGTRSSSPHADVLNVVILHVFHTEPSHDFGDLQLGAPALSPEERVAVWRGLPPKPVEHEGIAPVVLAGDIDGHWAYAERVPDGVRMSAEALPDELRRFVVAKVLDAVVALHAAGQVHGAVGPDRVILGRDGEVVLFGRGRRGGIPSMDSASAMSMLAEDGEEQTLPGDDAVDAAARLAADCRDDDPERLAEWVRAHLGGPPSGVDQVLLSVGALPDDGMDEVVPDLGPEMDGHGILDRWSVTTASGLMEATDEVTHGDGSGNKALATSLWTRLAAPRQHEPPDGRFAHLDGTASRGLRALLADEAPEPLPVPLSGELRTFVVERDESDETDILADEQPTVHGRRAPAFDLAQASDPDTGVDDDDETAVSRPPPELAGRRRRIPILEIVVALGLGAALVWLAVQLL